MRPADGRPSKMISKAFGAGFQRVTQRLRPWPVGSTNAAAAFDDYTKSTQGVRKGRPVALPRCEFKHRALGVPVHDRDDAGRAGPAAGDAAAAGRIRAHENTRKLVRRLNAGTARILSETVSFARGRWFVSLLVEVMREVRRPARPDVVGERRPRGEASDGAANSTGRITYEPNPAHLDTALAKLRRLSRRVSRRQGAACLASSRAVPSPWRVSPAESRQTLPRMRPAHDRRRAMRTAARVGACVSKAAEPGPSGGGVGLRWY
ncbi:hypothetical protein C8E86_5457 [Catellatospora citrea]|nr:hypothetical protein C8E86_5457 [Catellatospora citrea]